MGSSPHRIVQITDVYEDGRRRPVVVTSDERVVACTEEALHRVLGQAAGSSAQVGRPSDA